MNKSQITLTIFKLFGIATILTIVLITLLLIDGLKLIANLIESLNEEKLERVTDRILLKPIVPIKVANSKPQWMLDLLPRDYLNIKHLKAWAKQRRIKNYSKLSKSNLILALSPAG
jgi:hypothetical protein